MYLVSEYRVLKSAAGYYVGREYWDTEFNYWGPYERESGYYPDAESAQPTLLHCIKQDCLSSCEELIVDSHFKGDIRKCIIDAFNDA